MSLLGRSYSQESRAGGVRVGTSMHHPKPVLMLLRRANNTFSQVLQRKITVTKEGIEYSNAKEAYDALKSSFPNDNCLEEYLKELDSQNAIFHDLRNLKWDLEKKPMQFKGQTYNIQKIIPKQDRIYIVKDSTGKTFVIKKVVDEERFRKETSLMETVSGHENVIGIAGKDEGKKLILMEYATQDNLLSLYGKNKKAEYQHSEAKAKTLIKGILSGVKHIHSRGVYEGDLDAKNIFIGGTLENPVAKIADFGEGGTIGDADVSDSKPSDLFAIVSPIIQIATNGALTGWGALLGAKNLVEQYGASIAGFLGKLKEFGDAVRAWKNSPASEGLKGTAMTKLGELEATAWLT